MTDSIDVSSPQPFIYTTVEPRSPLVRLFKGIDYEAASVALGNLFADRSPEFISTDDIKETLAPHGIKNAKRIAIAAIQTYEQALARFLEKREIAPAEREYLKSLGRALGLTGSQLAEAHHSRVDPLFRSATRDAVKGDVLSDPDLENLRALGSRLDLSVEEQDKIRGEVVGPIIQAALTAAIKDHRYTKEEEESIRTLCANLKVAPVFEDAEKLDRFRLLERIDSGDFPVVDAPVSLQKSEVCHFTSEADWSETRAITQRINYSGPTARIRIMKGVYYRAGSIRPQRITRDVLTTIDSGHFYLTSKRVVFRGSRGNKVVPYSNLLGFEIYSDGLKLEKSAGKPPYLIFEGDIELAACILTAKLNQQ